MRPSAKIASLIIALTACGEKGKTYSATLRDGAGAPVFTVSKTFGQNTTVEFDFDPITVEPDDECDVIRLDQQPGWSALPPGTYTWTFTFDGRDINPGNLSYLGGGRPTVATTILEASQPSLSDGTFGDGVTMGVDEF